MNYFSQVSNKILVLKKFTFIEVFYENWLEGLRIKIATFKNPSGKIWKKFRGNFLKNYFNFCSLIIFQTWRIWNFWRIKKTNKKLNWKSWIQKPDPSTMFRNQALPVSITSTSRARSKIRSQRRRRSLFILQNFFKTLNVYQAPSSLVKKPSWNPETEAKTFPCLKLSMSRSLFDVWNFTALRKKLKAWV